MIATTAAFAWALIVGFCVGTLIGLWREGRVLRGCMRLLEQAKSNEKHSRQMVEWAKAQI